MHPYDSSDTTNVPAVPAVANGGASSARRSANGLPRFRPPSPEVIVALLVFALLALALHVPTLIGMADSHDFHRLMEMVGIQYPHLSDDLLYFQRVNRFYPLGGPIRTTGIYPSSTALVLALAVQISRLLEGSTFDLAIVGWLYVVLVACAAYVIARGLRRLIPSVGTVYAISALGGFVLLDIAYIAYFNSMYSEPTSYVFLLLMIGAALNIVASERPPYAMLALLFVGAGCFITAKFQNLAFALLIAGYLVWLVWLYGARLWRALAALAALVLVVIGLAVYVAIPPAYHQVDLYNAVFDGILLGASPAEARGDLRALGVDPAFAALAGQNYYTEQSLRVNQRPQFATAFFDRVGTTKIVSFYLTHPAVLIDRLQTSAASATTMRPNYLGNYTVAAGKLPTEQSDRMDLWSALKAKFVPPALWLLLSGFVLYFAGVVWSFQSARGRQSRALVALCALIGIMALTAFPIPYLFSGDFELVKHLFVFDNLGDLALVIAGAWALRLLFSPRVPSSARPR